MAITIQQAPATYSPVYNPIWFVCSSTNTAQENFEYICDIYITGVTFAGGATFLRLKTPADPTYGRGTFNPATILERELTSDLGNAIYGFQQCSNSILEYTCKFGELYGPSSGITAYSDLTVDSARYAFIGSLSVLDNKDYTVAVNVVNAASSNANVNILTNAPSSGTIRTDENAWIYVMSQTSGAIKYADIETYSDAKWSVVRGNYRVINDAYHNTSTVANRMLRFSSGWNLNSILNSSVYLTAQPIIITAGGSPVKSWRIFFTDTNYNRVTEDYYFTLADPCTAHDVYRIHFKNKWGGYDSFSFIRAHQITTDIKRNKFEKVLGEYKSGTSYTYNKTDKFERNIYTDYKHTIKLNSDWITETQSIWLEELFTSPEIILDDATHGLIPINITETKYTQRQHKTDRYSILK